MRRIRRSRGLTLVEVLVALLVLAIGLSGSLLTLLYASRFTAVATHLDEGTSLAQSLTTALMSVPYSAQLSAGGSPFSDSNVNNDGDIADSALRFAGSALPTATWAPDHSESELTGTSFAAMVRKLPLGYSRYWNVAPLPSGNGVAIAVVVRWVEGRSYKRTVVVGTRYSP